jgi:S1-C subfamily serine protease
MKKLTAVLCAAIIYGMTLQVSAASASSSAPAAATSAANTENQAKLQQELEQARQKLQEDARRLSELSMQLNGPEIDKYVYVYRRDHGAGERGFLGVGLKETRGGAGSQGVRIAHVTPDGPADKAGLKAGDLITSIDGKTFADAGNTSAADQLVQFMNGVKPGESLTVQYLRGGKQAAVTVVAGKMNNEDIKIDMRDFMHGPVLGINIDTGASGNGVMLAGVTPGGPAEKAGLRTGDVLTSINGTALKPEGDKSSGDILLDYMDNVRPGDSLKLDYHRNGKNAVAMVTAENPRDFLFNLHLPAMPRMSPAPPAPPMPPMMMGGYRMFLGHGQWRNMQLVPMSPGLGRYFGTDKGLLVLRAPEDSALKLQDGDVILKIGGRDPGSPPHAMRIFGSYGPGDTLPLEIMRRGKALKLSIKLPPDGDLDMRDDVSGVLRSLHVDPDLLKSGVK